MHILYRNDDGNIDYYTVEDGCRVATEIEILGKRLYAITPYLEVADFLKKIKGVSDDCSIQCSTGKQKSEDCVLEFKKVTVTLSHNATKQYLCTTHQQWVHETCVFGTLTYTFEDGSIQTFILDTDDKGYWRLRAND
jgi:hypothetical protein